VKVKIIKKNESVQDRTLETWISIYGSGRDYTNNIVSFDSIFGHAASREVISSAAVNWANINTIEPYSSEGPVTIRFPTNETRSKPDITGVDNVSVTGAGGFGSPFPGTSAAVPHITGIAALIWSKDPSKSAAEIKTAILNNADPKGDSFIFGSGLANASSAYYSLYPPGISITSISPSTGVNTGSVTITNLSGTLFQSGATVNLTRTGQPNITASNVQVVSSSQITCTLPLTGKADGQSGILANGFTVTAPSPGNTPFVIDTSAMNTLDGQYLSSRGFRWCNFGGVNNSYYKITLPGISQFPTEFHHEKFHNQGTVRDPGTGIKRQDQRNGSLHGTQC